MAQVCREKRILLCAIDQAAYCDVVNVSVFDQGRLCVTIGTGGAAPAVSKKIRMGLERSLKEEPLEEFFIRLRKICKIPIVTSSKVNLQKSIQISFKDTSVKDIIYWVCQKYDLDARVC